MMVDGATGDLGNLATNKQENEEEPEYVTIQHQLMEELPVLAPTEKNLTVKVNYSQKDIVLTTKKPFKPLLMSC